MVVGQARNMLNTERKTTANMGLRQAGRRTNLEICAFKEL